MLFPTYTYIYFLLLVVLLRWAVPRRAVPGLLLGASYVFYLSWGLVYGLLIGGLTVLTWAGARALERWPDRRKTVMAACVSAALGVLATFKYAAFFATNVGLLLNPDDPAPELKIVLPLGVSFFTFQMVSYVVDVYRGSPAERSLPRYALYIAFFPQLIAGPIVRANELLPQLIQAPAFDADRFSRGMDLLLRGLFKKIVIADNMAILADVVFKDPGTHSTLVTWLGVLAYAGQIYGDFSGYTDIARGSGRMLGIELPENFTLPYLSASITEFWRRWHMTLSRWLRDYLYIPLGGNQKGRRRQSINLMVTMLLGGLWHGAGWTFVIWGGIHGLLLGVHKGWRRLTFGTPLQRWREAWLYRAVMLLVTLFAVCMAWVFFRAPDLAVAGTVFEGLFGAGPPAPAAVDQMTLMRAYFALGGLVLWHLLAASPPVDRLWERLWSAPRGATWATAVVALYLLGGPPAEFIYFQF